MNRRRDDQAKDGTSSQPAKRGRGFRGQGKAIANNVVVSPCVVGPHRGAQLSDVPDLLGMINRDCQP